VLGIWNAAGDALYPPGVIGGLAPAANALEPCTVFIEAVGLIPALGNAGVPVVTVGPLATAVLSGFFLLHQANMSLLLQPQTVVAKPATTKTFANLARMARSTFTNCSGARRACDNRPQATSLSL
jgi:hypothetical protein